MGMTILEKILSHHSVKQELRPGDIVDVEIDARVARDFGGANVVKNIRDNDLGIDDTGKTLLPLIATLPALTRSMLLISTYAACLPVNMV